MEPLANWRVNAVKVLPNYCLLVRFNDDLEGTVDLNGLVHSAGAGVFAKLAGQVLFAQARVERGVVTWPGEIDLAPDAMYAAIKTNGVWVLS